MHALGLVSVNSHMEAPLSTMVELGKEIYFQESYAKCNLVTLLEKLKEETLVIN